MPAPMSAMVSLRSGVVTACLSRSREGWLSHTPGSAPLIGRRAHDQAVERLGYLDLARQPRIGAHVESGVEFGVLVGRGRSDALQPGLIDIDVAGRAGAAAAAFR